MISERLLVYIEATHFPTTSLSWGGKGQRETGVGREYCRCSGGMDQHGVCPLGMTDPGCVET